MGVVEEDVGRRVDSGLQGFTWADSFILKDGRLALCCGFDSASSAYSA